MNIEPHRREPPPSPALMKSALTRSALMLSALMLSGIAILHARADESASRPVSSRHQLMKECMAKQKASNAGLSSDQMKKTCRDLAETEVENAKAERMRGQAGGTPQK